MLTPEITKFIDVFVSEIQGVKEIWLVGSRANCTFKEESDWDFVVFLSGNQKTFSQIQRRKDLRHEDVDLLIVYDGDKFEEPWPFFSKERYKPKSGSLKDWEWKIVSESEARYTAIDGRLNEKYLELNEEARGIKVWPVLCT
ncbi:hypothetical protein MNBD_DELTA01-551 [hydrothermal vent metagenome]|uniref:Polymerase nucleotidyl transferase domain-containing protein n=1 Tax=hydrothermal vent metagenome TaxID=652676 RepID=A0A3B0QUP2_9ZZZZ